MGEVVRGYTLPNGLELRQVRVPFGVVGIIYEARPNVTADAAGICLKSGNAVLLRGSSSAAASNEAIIAVLRDAAASAGLPADVVQGVPLARYEANVMVIRDALLARLPPARVVVVTVPDYTVTPAGADYGDPAERAAAIRAVNAAMTWLAASRGLAVVDIHDVSLEAADDRSLVADDGLHPSGAQYARWVERLVPVVRDAIGG